MTEKQRRPGRAGLAVAAVASLGASFLAGMVAAGGLGTATVAPPIGVLPDAGGAPLRLANADLTVPGSCEALLESYVERGVDRVGPYGWDFPFFTELGPAMVDRDGAAEGLGSGAAAGEAAEAPARSGVVEQGSSATGTNVQETGVDEPDGVKTDGELLVRELDGELVVYDVTGVRPVELADVDLPRELGSPELLLAGDTVVVTGGQLDRWGTAQATTHVLSYDLSDPASPMLVDHRSFTAGLVRAVQHGDDVRLVLQSSLPDLDFVQPRWWRREEGALERNRETVRRSTIEDWLPSVTTYDAAGSVQGTEQLVDCAQVTVPSTEAALGTMTVVGFDVDDPATADTLAVATDTGLAYFSSERMYLATSGWGWSGCCWDGVVAPRPASDVGRTHLYAFALEGTGATYVASGVVDGVVADRWAMDEHDGVLRLAVGPSQETGNFSSVVTLREDGDDLEEVGRADKLGVDEEIKSVRWFDDLAIVVTFRQVDPLYAVDLSDPAEPELLGELKIPGFSEYLHPISGQRLIGLGQDATPEGQLRGAQAALFDVADLTDPRRTDVVTYRAGSRAGAATDTRQFTWLPGRSTALTVVADGWSGSTGRVSVLSVDGDRLDNRMVEVEYGSDVADVRLVPLPDDRVVLVTGEDVSFFAL